MQTIREARQLGRKTNTFSGVIERVKLIEYAKALHLRNPIHIDPVAAIEAGYRDIVATSGFITSMTLQPRAVKFAVYEIDESRALAGEMEWIHKAVVCAGDVLSGHSELIETSIKGGNRPMDILVIETTLKNQMGEIVLIVRESTLETHKLA
jgi:acyl dehydratase